MARPKQNLPRALRQAPPTRTARPRGVRTNWASKRRLGAIGVLAATLAVAAVVALSHTGSTAAPYAQIDQEVNTLLAEIPQQGSALGDATAPVTLQVFLDLEDPSGKEWFAEYLPQILEDDVRTGALRLEYHAFKTNTYWPTAFIKQQTAALAAGAQDKLWNYLGIFYREQGKELTHYVTEPYLNRIASQIPGLNLAQWHTDRTTGRREEQTAAEDQQAKALDVYVTPGFRIGRTGGAMKNFSGSRIIRYAGQKHPVALVQAQDLTTPIQELSK